MKKLKIYRKYSSQNQSVSKNKHSTLYNYFTTGGPRNFDKNRKIANLQCSWIKQLHEDSLNEWKLIPVHLINTTIILELKFHASLPLNFDLDQFPKFYHKISQFWSTFLHSTSTFPSINYQNFYGFIKILRLIIDLFFSTTFLTQELTSFPISWKKMAKQNLEWL